LEERLRAVPEQQNSEASQKEIIRARTKEAKYIASLFKVMNGTKWGNHDKTRFIISAKWFSKWKAYVGYDELFTRARKNSSACSVHSNTTNHSSFHYSFLSTPYPGSISNEILLADPSDSFHDFTCPTTICNTVLRDTAVEGKDFYIVTKDIWTFFHSNYGGLAIPRHVIPMGSNGESKIDLHLSRVKKGNIRIG
jgi:hypothetical protein